MKQQAGKEFIKHNEPHSGPVQCPYCGQKIEEPENYCFNCGGKIALVCLCWKKDGQPHSCPGRCDTFTNNLYQ